MKEVLAKLPTLVETTLKEVGEKKQKKIPKKINYLRTLHPGDTGVAPRGGEVSPW